MSKNIQFEQLEQNQQKDAYEYNKGLIKSYITHSKISFIVLLVIWLIFLIECILTWTWSMDNQDQGVRSISPYVLVIMGANISFEVSNGAVYRLITAIGLHAGIMHIFANSTSLIVFCGKVETSVTRKVYLISFILGGIQGNMLSDLYNLNLGNMSTIAVGASTSICAIMGLYVSKIYLASKQTGNVEFAKKQIMSMIISLFIFSMMPGVDFFGHFGSLFSGILIGLSLLETNQKGPRIFGRILLIIYSLILCKIFI